MKLKIWTRRTTFGLLVGCVCVTTLVSIFSLAAGSPSKTRTRIEELFVWRVSDTLGLEPKIEAQFASEFKRLSEKKAQLWEDMEALVTEMDRERDPKKLASSLDQYRKKMELHNRIQIEEFETFQKLFGKEKLAKYLVLKRELTQKLKDFVSSPSRPESASPKRQLVEPKVIQDESQ